MDKEALKQILPHREPMLWVDEAYMDEDRVAHGKYHVRGDEWFLQGHFPGNPVVPGVIQCEIMAQTCCVLLAEEIKGNLTFITAMDGFRFKHQVVPGDTLEIESRITKYKAGFYFAEGKGYVDGKLCVSGKYTFALMKNPQNEES